MFPTKRQWKSWSLPSKLGAIGTLITVLSFVAYITEKVYALYNQSNNREKQVTALLLKDTEISVICTSNYIDYLSSGEVSATDVGIKFINDTRNTLDIQIELIHTKINGPLLGPFSSPYVVSRDEVYGKDNQITVLKPFSDFRIKLSQFASTEKYASQNLYLNKGINQLYPDLPSKKFTLISNGHTYRSTLKDFRPPIPRKLPYIGVGLVVRVSVIVDEITVTRTFYGGFAKRSSNSKLNDVKNKKPTYYQFLSGIYDSGIIIVKNGNKTNLYSRKTQVINKNLGEFNPKNGYASATVWMKAESFPYIVNAPIRILAPSSLSILESIEY